jgi:predicted DNA-binding WGR domain protein
MDLQLPLFPETIAMTRIRPDKNERRFYRMEVRPDLFGRTVLIRQWGRIGTFRRQRLDHYPDIGAAVNALAERAKAKQRRGYSVTY